MNWVMMRLCSQWDGSVEIYGARNPVHVSTKAGFPVLYIPSIQWLTSLVELWQFSSLQLLGKEEGSWGCSVIPWLHPCPRAWEWGLVRDNGMLSLNLSALSNFYCDLHSMCRTWVTILNMYTTLYSHTQTTPTYMILSQATPFAKKGMVWSRCNHWVVVKKCNYRTQQLDNKMLTSAKHIVT